MTPMLWRRFKTITQLLTNKLSKKYFTNHEILTVPSFSTQFHSIHKWYQYLCLGFSHFELNILGTRDISCVLHEIQIWNTTWNIVSFHFSLIRMTKLSPPLIRAIINGKIIFFVWLCKSETHENFGSLRHCHTGLESGSQNKVAFDTKLFKDNETSLCFFRKNPHDRIFYNAKDGHSIFHQKIVSSYTQRLPHQTIRCLKQYFTWAMQR